MPAELNSRKNEIVCQAAALGDSAALRRETGLYLCEGARLCADAARSGVALYRFFYTRAAFEKYGGYIEACLAACEEAYLIAEPVAQRLAQTRNTQGVFALCRMKKQTQRLPAGGRLVVLENVQDPANLGTVLRTAEALGLPGVLLCGEGCDLYAPKTLRASMGAVFRLPCFAARDAAAAFSTLRAAGYRSFAAVPDARVLSVTACGFGPGCAVWIGNEGAGLSESAVAGCDERITIPMAGRAESLNAAAAAAILMWELCRSGGAENG